MSLQKHPHRYPASWRAAMASGRDAARLAICLLLTATTLAAQAPERRETDPQAARVSERLRALQNEAARLAGESKTLVGELRALEIDRDLRTEEARLAESAVADAQQKLQAATDRLNALEQARVAQLPDLQTRFVDIYKRGRAGYARLLFSAGDLREFARATRAIASLAAINEQRIAEHRRTLEALRQERSALEQTTRELQERQAAAQRARSAADRAVTARTALIARIDSRRDLTAQYVGELQVAYDRLQQQVTNLGGTAGDAVALPLAPFRGALDWPVAGQVTSRFGQASGRLGGTAVKNGVEIAAPEGTPVRAVHGGTVGYAAPFTGFGTLVIVDHGANNYSLYGYLGTVTVERGQVVESGAELGRVGPAPAGPPAVYFEMRIDGRSVDPLQWIRPR